MVLSEFIRRASPLVFGLSAAAALGCAAQAQTMSTNSASFNAGYGRTAASDNAPVDVSTRDGNGNLTVVNGIIMSGSGAGYSAYAQSGGVSTSTAGVGSGGSTAIGNNLSVITQGSWNTVIVNSTQINNGNVTANSSGGN